MSNFKQIKNEFNKLSDMEKENLVREIYNFSKDMKLFLESKFIGNDIGREFIDTHRDTPPCSAWGKDSDEAILRKSIFSCKVWLYDHKTY